MSAVESGEIFKLIPKVMKEIGSISKDRKNEQQKYSFRGIEDFYQAAHPAMINHGIFCAPKVLSRDVYRFEKTNDMGKVTIWLHVALEVEHRFYAGDGSFVPVTTWGEGLDNSDKATNKAMSGAMKYALIELFCVPTKDVEDSDRDSPEAGKARVKMGEKTQAAPQEPVTLPPPLPKPNGTATEAQPVKGIPEGQRSNFKTTFERAVRKERKKDVDGLYVDYMAAQKINFDTMDPKDFYAVRDEAEAYAKKL